MIQELSKWAHQTIIKIQDPKKQDIGKCVVNSISKLEKMLGSHPKIANIANASKKKTVERLREAIPGLPPCAADEIWALVDSGSTLNAADIMKHFPEYASKVHHPVEGSGTRRSSSNSRRPRTEA